MNIILIGFKKVGKSTLGKQLAAQLGYQFIDTDRLIEQRYSVQNGIARSCEAIYKHDGANKFRALEQQAIANLHNINDTIVATGGGTIINQESSTALRKLGHIVYLKADKEQLKKRIFTHKLPAFLNASKQPEVDFEQLFAQRSPCYESAADSVIDTNNKSLEQVVEELTQVRQEYGE